MNPSAAQILLELHESGRDVAPLEKVELARRVLAEALAVDEALQALEDEIGGVQ